MSLESDNMMSLTGTQLYTIAQAELKETSDEPRME